MQGGSFGILVKADKDYRGGRELRMDPAKQHAQWGTPTNGTSAAYIPQVWDHASPHMCYFGSDFALENVEGLDKPFTLDVIVKSDPTTKVTLVDACIGGEEP